MELSSVVSYLGMNVGKPSETTTQLLPCNSQLDVGESRVYLGALPRYIIYLGTYLLK